jgi:hypothetical protein
MKWEVSTFLRTLRGGTFVRRHCLPLLFGTSLILAALFANGPSLAANPGRPLNTELTGGWHFVRTPNPQGGADAISIMHTADVSKSDLDLAGMMIRCRNHETEALVILLRPFAVRAHPRLVLGEPGNEIHFKATVAAPGTAILIPKNAAELVNGPWQSLDDLFIRVGEGPSAIRGVVSLAGLRSAFKMLTANCYLQ